MQAVKQLKDRPEDYGYLFKGHNNAGVGGKSSEKLNEADYKSVTLILQLLRDNTKLWECH